MPISPLQSRLGAACPPVAPAKLLQALGAGTATHRLAQACECSACGPAFEGLLEHRGDSLAQGQAPTACPQPWVVLCLKPSLLVLVGQQPLHVAQASDCAVQGWLHSDLQAVNLSGILQGCHLCADVCVDICVMNLFLESDGPLEKQFWRGFPLKTNPVPCSLRHGRPTSLPRACLPGRATPAAGAVYAEGAGWGGPSRGHGCLAGPHRLHGEGPCPPAPTPQAPPWAAGHPQADSQGMTASYSCKNTAAQQMH